MAEDADAADQPATLEDYAAMRFEPDPNAALIFEKPGTEKEWMEHAAHDWFLIQIALKSISTMDDEATARWSRPSGQRSRWKPSIVCAVCTIDTRLLRPWRILRASGTWPVSAAI